jgi:hypothetical protein
MKKEIKKAREWLERAQLTVPQFSEISGYSEKALYWYFRGLTPPRTAKHIAGYQKSAPVDARVWRRFKWLCAGVNAELIAGKEFDW